MDDGLGAFEAGFEDGLSRWIVLEVVGLIPVSQNVIEGTGVLAIELEEIAILDILVDTSCIVDGPSEVVGRVEQIASEGDIGLIVMKGREDGRHHVDLLGDGMTTLWSDECARGVEEDERRAKVSEVGLIKGLVGEVCVVAGDDEEGAFVPGLGADAFEEAA